MKEGALPTVYTTNDKLIAIGIQYQHKKEQMNRNLEVRTNTDRSINTGVLHIVSL